MHEVSHDHAPPKTSYPEFLHSLSGDGLLPCAYTAHAKGRACYPQGTDAYPQGTACYPEGTDAYPQGTACYPEGTGRYPLVAARNGRV